MLFKRKAAKAGAPGAGPAAPAVPAVAPAAPTARPAVDADGELDVRSLGRALWRRKRAIILPTIIVAVLTAVTVEVVTPKYKSSANLLYEGRENIFLRPEVDKAVGDRALADLEALTSQVQLVLSRELA